MFKNYIKLAWRILGRKKFFTFISMFGISFTLGILMVALSFLQSELGTTSPLSNKDDMVYMGQLRLQRVYYDTIPTIDTLFENGVEVYDTSYEYNRRGSMQWNSEINNEVLEDHLLKVQSAKTISIFSSDFQYDVYVNGVKLTLNMLYSDHNYFEIFDHKMIEGRSFDNAEHEKGSQVAVISDKTANNYFGNLDSAVGNEIEVDGKNYLVIGIYKNQGKIAPFVSPDLIVPYKNLNLDNQDTYYHGFFNIMFLKGNGSSIERLKKDIHEAGKMIPLDHPTKPEGYNEVVLYPMTYNEMYAKAVYYEEDASKSLSIMKWILLSLLLFFVFLPTLNLINLNVSRILERSSEIGVRKAFGAHQGNIVSQFIVENLVQTLIGGLLGLGLALLVINMINNGGHMGDSVLRLNPKFFIYSFIVTMLFGLLSGLLPAYRMSKLQIVNALKENTL